MRQSSDDSNSSLRLAVAVVLRDEARYLPRFLGSVVRQTRPADQLILVDDGSQDASLRLIETFARDNEHVRAVSHPRQSLSGTEAMRDRLVSAPELRALTWGVEQLEDDWDIVAKMDADLALAPTLFKDVGRTFAEGPDLGIVGSYLSVERIGGTEREENPAHHVRGPNKFYRRDC